MILGPRKRLFVSLLPAIIAVISTLFSWLTRVYIVSVPVDSDFHFNLITVNALFGGFLYTNYSLLIGVLDNPLIDRVKNTNIISRRNSHILHGIIYATISVIAGLIFILLPHSQSKCIWFISCLLLNIEIYFMAFLILYFVLSLIEMNTLVSSLSKPQKQRSKAEIEKIKDGIAARSRNSI